MSKKQKTIFRVITDPWVKPYLQQNKKLLTLVIVLGVGTFASAAALMYTSGFLISKSATRPENVLLVYIPIVLVRAFGIARPAFKYSERLASHNLVLKSLSSMRVKLYRRLERQALTLKNRFSSGDLLGIFAEDVEQLQNLFLRTIFPTIFAIILYVIAILLLGWFSIPFALLMLLWIFVLIVIFPLVSLLVTRKRHEQMKTARHALYENLTDAVAGISDWNISGRQADFLRSYENQEKALDESEKQMEAFKYRRNFLFQIITACIIVTMVFFSGTSADNGEFGNVWIAAFVLVVFPILEAFMPIPDAISQLPSYENSLTRMNKLDQVNDRQTNEFGLAEALAKQDGLNVIFDDVAFSYSSYPIVQSLSFTIKQGEKIALLGKSGAGKSTIVKLLLGAYEPDHGEVTIKGRNVGLMRDEMHNLVAVLQQKPHLFDSTVMNNIRLGNPQASDEEVIEAAKQVQLHDFISSLPEGYNTRMKELGMRFSGGERHRIALARILLQNAPIIILDEPTLGLDPITERALLSTIFTNLQDKTVLYITHHLVGVEMMDRVLFLENGRIALDGTHGHLLETNSHYQQLYRLDRP